MYKIEKKENYEIYAFDEIDLRIKIVNNNLLKNVYINYKGYNPLFTMLLGEFSADCEIDSYILMLKVRIVDKIIPFTQLYKKKF